MPWIVLNVISLGSGLPISLLSLERAGSSLLVRYGTQDERFVFNASAQELDVEGLISICRYDGLRTIPIGTPVKDSQFAKVVVGDRHVLGCLYAARSAVSAAMLESLVARTGGRTTHLVRGPGRCTCGLNRRSGEQQGRCSAGRWTDFQVRPGSCLTAD